MSINDQLKYYLGSLATQSNLAGQTKKLRDVIDTHQNDPDIFSGILTLLTTEKDIHADSVHFLIKVIMPNYGAEYTGVGGADWSMKADFLESLITLFPAEYAFKFYYADCACMAGMNIENYYPLLEDGMRKDGENKYYPSTELFEAIAESEFSFQFDVLLLEKYYQPCTEEAFQDYLTDFRLQYTNSDQQAILDKIFWKEN